MTIANGIAGRVASAGGEATAPPAIFRMADAARVHLGDRSLPQGIRCRLLRVPEGGGDEVVYDSGHGPILVRSAATGAVRTLPPQGPPLGFLPEARYAAAVEVPLAPGDVFMVLTDGFYEWPRRDGEPFGVERIAKFLGAHGDLTARELIDGLREAVVAFAGGTPQADDLTAVVVRRTARADVPA